MPYFAAAYRGTRGAAAHHDGGADVHDRAVVRPANRAARPCRLTFESDTTSGGSHRQNKHAGHVAMPSC